MELMSKLAAVKELDKTTKELQEFILQAKRKLLEVDVMVGESEIKTKKTKLKSYQSVDDLVKDL